MSISLTTFDFVYDEKEFIRVATCGPNEVVTDVTTSLPNVGVNITWLDDTVTVSGTFQKVFSESTWSYIPTYDFVRNQLPATTTVTTRSTNPIISEVPSTLFEFVKGTHDTTLEYPITYTVHTLETIENVVPEVPPTISTDPNVPDDPGSPGYTYYTYENHTYTINHRVCNNWDIFKNQLIELISRGSKYASSN